MNVYLLFLVPVLLVLLYFVQDYRGPRTIKLRSATFLGMSYLRAKDLVVQEYDVHGHVWASRGMILYRLKKGDSAFERMAHVPSAFSVLWFNNFSLFRRFLNQSECLETTVSEDGYLCVFSSGYMMYRDSTGKKFIRAMKLPRFGLGIGRGMLSNGLLQADDKLVLFGEYFRNDERKAVSVYSSRDFGKTWDTAYTFKAGTIRHIHALQKDPYTGKIWICTGDEDIECMIGCTENGFRTLDIIGQGSQQWRTCHLVFSEEAVYWGTDTGSDEFSGIWKWDRHSGNANRILQVDGALFYGTRLYKGTMVMSTDREGFPNEKDKKTRLFVVDSNHSISEIPWATWKHDNPGFQFNFAKLRFQRNQDQDALVLTCLNQKELPESELVIVQEEALNRLVKKQTVLS